MNLYRHHGGFPLKELLNWPRMKKARLSIRELVAIVYRLSAQGLFLRPCDEAPTGKYDMPGPDCDSTTAYFRDNGRTRTYFLTDEAMAEEGKTEPGPSDELAEFGNDAVYSPSLLCDLNFQISPLCCSR